MRTQLRQLLVDASEDYVPFARLAPLRVYLSRVLHLKLPKEFLNESKNRARILNKKAALGLPFDCGGDAGNRTRVLR